MKASFSFCHIQMQICVIKERENLILFPSTSQQNLNDEKKNNNNHVSKYNFFPFQSTLYIQRKKYCYLCFIFLFLIQTQIISVREYIILRAVP